MDLALPSRRAARLADVRATVALAAPLIGGQLSTMAQGVVDVMLAGHRGAHVLGAVAVGTSVWMVAVLAAAGIMLALPPSVAQLDGARRREEIGPLFIQSLWLAGGVGLVLMLAVRWAGPALATAAGVAPSLRPGVTAFLHAISFAAPAASLLFACRGLSEGLSLPKPSLMVGLLGLLLLAPLGYVLIYGRLGLPALDARGSGIANGIVPWLQLLAFGLWLRVSRRYRALGWRHSRGWPQAAAILGLLRLGAPMATSVLLETSLFCATGLAIGRFGDTAVAGHQVALNVAGVTFMVPLGLALAITVRVGHAMGRGDIAAARRAGLVGIALALCFEAASATLMLSVPGAIARIYSTDPGVIAGAAGLLRLAGIFQFSDGVQVSSNGALRGLKDTRRPMLVTAFAYWGVGMPVGLALAFGFRLGPPGMWMGLIAGLTAAALLLSGRFLSLTAPGRRRRS